MSAILKMNFNFNIKDMPEAENASTKERRRGRDSDHAVELTR
jgi:hypothetical protein